MKKVGEHCRGGIFFSQSMTGMCAQSWCFGSCAKEARGCYKDNPHADVFDDCKLFVPIAGDIIREHECVNVESRNVVLVGVFKPNIMLKLKTMSLLNVLRLGTRKEGG